ncbi:MAG: hypothetical protein FJ271_09560 [Planctomycetes bacterium]|nr:hypothetical protein [Planctomycetota bacterium]
MAKNYVRLCVIASAIGIIGIMGIAELAELEARTILFVTGPHVLGLASTCWLGWLQPTAGQISLSGSLGMAVLQWWDTLGRRADGLDWRFNNDLSAGLTCLGNYFIVVIILCVTGTYMARHQCRERN